MHAAGADYELAMVDVASDSLLGVPAAMVRALAELLSYETEGEGNVLDEVAERLGRRGGHALWCRTRPGSYVQQLAELAAGRRPRPRKTGLYVWTS